MTKTTELAHYVLPAATFLERSELHCHAAIQTVNLTRRIFSLPGVQDEYQFLHELASRLHMKEHFPWQDEDELNRWLLEPTGLSTDELLEHPEGIQYKPIRYEKWRNQKMPTPSGKVEFASDHLKRLGLPELPDYLPTVYATSNQNKGYPYLLISGIRSTLFAYGHCHSSKQPVIEPDLEMNNADATLLGLRTGDEVLVSSRIGSVSLKVKLVSTDDIISGCVAIDHGSYINAITMDDVLDPLDGFPALKSVPVKIEKL